MEATRVGVAPVYSLEYHPHQHILALRWRGTYSLRELQESYRAALNLARRYGSAHWLLDSRRAGPIDLYVTQWLTQNFLPRAVARLAPRVLRLAVLCSPARLAQLHTDAPVGEAVAEAFAAPHPYHTRVFTAEAEAMAWLLREDQPAALSPASQPVLSQQLVPGRQAGDQQREKSGDAPRPSLFRTVFENSPLGHKIVTPDLTICQVNPALVAMLGCTRADQVEGRRILDFAHPHYRADWCELQEQLWACKIPCFTLQTCLIRADGTLLWCQVHSVRLSDHGQEMGYTTLIDTTAHMELHTSIKRLYDSQETALHMAAHDVRNSLANIKLSVELLRREQVGEEAQYLAIIEQAAVQAEAILKDVLYLGQLDAGQLRKQSLDFSAYLDAHLDTHRLVARAKGVTLVLEVPSHAVQANLNPHNFGRVVDNLVSNALKFTPAGGRVTVRLDKPAGRLRLAVQDTGIGIPAEYHAHLFDKFSTAAREGLAGESATGLGLFITQQIVRLHGGLIRVESRENEGTTFVVDL
ncbi:PAS domain-containing sensor histidine kinase [Hymenobacter negativus]|uniref:histidine kinase n=1 Tax=Hymenobacter negativus TaxID=2795026 RepID=A0ABS3QIX3_9BACT|nr:PAS domain-containing sensor histidine kinase [Hymenobacter negativus]MBO2010734.1 PAS domain-containing sensor histidine kinase [Hymenobacter negativus]